MSDDPYLWLEEVSGVEALAWVRERNAESAAALAEGASFKGLEERLRAILDSDARIPFVGKMGDRYYNFWKDAQHERGIWRRTTLDQYRRPEPEWESVLDLDALSQAEGEAWVWHGASPLRPDFRRCLVGLSRGGKDADVTREFDLLAREFVPGGFERPEAKGHLGWVDLDTVYAETDFGPGSMTESGYPRLVKEWQRGTSLADAALVYEGRPEDMSVGAWHDPTPGFERDFVYRAIAFYRNEVYLRRGGGLLKIEKPDDASVSVHRDLLLIELRSDWSVDGRLYRAGSLLAADFEAFLAGARDLDILLEPDERTSLAGFSATRGALLLHVLDNVRSRLYVLRREGDTWRREPLPGLSEFAALEAWAVDAIDSDDYFFTESDYLTPTRYGIGSVAGGLRPPEVLKELPAFFEAKGLSIRQHEGVSADGTRVPYFLVARDDLGLDGGNPTLLSGYGGFEIPMVPHYDALVGSAWLEPGGVYVVANIRGGGEFGPRWHQAALKENRHRAYDDFIAVAEDLIRRGVTSPAKLGIIGGSNGGLLMGNMLTRRPDLFGAIVCAVPLLDMQRYHKLLAGASWMAEYGDPDKPEEWEFIRTFSPYHNVDSGTTYPPVFFYTSTRDDRVHPGHARKMVAKMRAQGHDVLYYENTEGGHAGSATNEQAAHLQALAYTFLWQKLGG